jgi:hypothetical protein
MDKSKTGLACYICLESPDKNITLLKCGHYCCPKCYCEQKDRKINHCQVCFTEGIVKKLIRGTRKNK